MVSAKGGGGLQGTNAHPTTHSFITQNPPKTPPSPPLVVAGLRRKQVEKTRQAAQVEEGAWGILPLPRPNPPQPSRQGAPPPLRRMWGRSVGEVFGRG